MAIPDFPDLPRRDFPRHSSCAPAPRLCALPDCGRDAPAVSCSAESPDSLRFVINSFIHVQRKSKISTLSVAFVLPILEGGWLPYENTLLDCGVHCVNCTPNVTYAQ